MNRTALVVGIVWGATILAGADARAQAPPNDLCENAMVVGEGSFPFDNSNATDTFDPPCTSSAGGADVWFRYSPSAAGQVTLSTCASSVIEDTILVVYKSDRCSPDPLTSVACNDNAGCGATAALSSLSFYTDAEAIYLVNVQGRNGASGAGVLDVSLTPGSTTPPEFVEDFEPYRNGHLTDQSPDWAKWDDQAFWDDAAVVPSGAVNEVEAFSGDKHALLQQDVDVVRELGALTGQWNLSGWVYIPTGTTGEVLFILMNTYVHGSGNTKNWSAGFVFDASDGSVRLGQGSNNPQTGELPLANDTWMEFKAEVNVDANTTNYFVDGVQLNDQTDMPHQLGGSNAIAALTVFTVGVTPFVFTDLISAQLEEAGQQFIRGDWNGDGVLNGLIDSLFGLEFLFVQGPQPVCREAGDWNNDGKLSLPDVLDELNYFFLQSGLPPPAPFPGCGIDPQPAGLDCEAQQPDAPEACPG